MKAHLTYKHKDPWSGVSIYDNCMHYLSTYIKRNGLNYTGLDHDDNLRERLENELRLEPGALRPSSDYWETYNIPITQQGVYIETSTPKGELDFYFTKGHKRVQFGLKDNKPGADYLLIQEEEEAKVTNLRNKTKRQAITEFDKLTPSEMRKALRIYGHNSTNVSAEVAESTLYDLVENDPKKFIDIWVNNTKKETVFLIEEAVAKQILRKDRTVYKYGSDVIGYTLDEAVDYLDNPTNSSLYLTIKAQIDGKDYALGEKKATKVEGDSQFAKIMKEIESEDSGEIESEEPTVEEVKEEPNKKQVKNTKKSDK